MTAPNSESHGQSKETKHRKQTYTDSSRGCLDKQLPAHDRMRPVVYWSYDQKDLIIYYEIDELFKVFKILINSILKEWNKTYIVVLNTQHDIIMTS